MATLLLPAPRFDWLLPATASAPNREVPDFALILNSRPVIIPTESAKEVAELHRDFLEMAYRRNLQTPGEYFGVSQWYRGPGGLGPQEIHPHRRVANALVAVGLLQAHPANNGSRSRFRINTGGIVLVEEVLDRWVAETAHDPDVWLPRFESYARQLKFDGWLILPEPGRSWRFEQAFENEAGRRSLHRIQWVGFPDGHGWKEYNKYFYSQPGWDYRETAAYKHFRQPIRMEIDF